MEKGLFIPHFLEEMFTFLETFPKMDTFLKCPQCARLIVGVQTRLEKNPCYHQHVQSNGRIVPKFCRSVQRNPVCRNFGA